MGPVCDRQSRRVPPLRAALGAGIDALPTRARRRPADTCGRERRSDVRGRRREGHKERQRLSEAGARDVVRHAHQVRAEEADRVAASARLASSAAVGFWRSARRPGTSVALPPRSLLSASAVASCSGNSSGEENRGGGMSLGDALSGIAPVGSKKRFGRRASRASPRPARERTGHRASSAISAFTMAGIRTKRTHLDPTRR